MDVKSIVGSIIFLSVISAAMGQTLPYKVIYDILYKPPRDSLRQPNHRPAGAPNSNDSSYGSQLKFAISILHH